MPLEHVLTTRTQISLRIRAFWPASSLSANQKTNVIFRLCGCAGCSGPEVIFFLCSTQLSMKFHLVIKIKIPTIKTFFMLNSAEHAQLSWTWNKVLKNCKCFKIYKQNKFHAQLSWAWKKFYNLGVRSLLFSYGPNSPLCMARLVLNT